MPIIISTQDLIDAGICDRGIDEATNWVPGRPLDEKYDMLDLSFWKDGKHNPVEGYMAIQALAKNRFFNRTQYNILKDFLAEGGPEKMEKEIMAPFIASMRKDPTRFSYLPQASARARDAIWKEFLKLAETLQWRS